MKTDNGLDHGARKPWKIARCVKCGRQMLFPNTMNSHLKPCPSCQRQAAMKKLPNIGGPVRMTP